MRARQRARRSNLIVLGLTGALAAGGLVGLARPAVAASCPQNGTTVTCTFNDAADDATFVVPAGVTSATVTVQGGAGGNGAGGGGQGGAGGVTSTTLALTPGTSLGIFVGGVGGDGAAGCGTGGGGVGGLSGGTPTGGAGGAGDGAATACAGGGGGGGSFIMTGGQTPASIELEGPSTAVLLVAGGGGGGGAGVLDDPPFRPHNNGGSGGSATARAGQGGSDVLGGGAQVTPDAFGQPGDPAFIEQNRHAGGGGGGGYGGGGKGNVNCDGGPVGGPGCGGGGGGGLPTPPPPPPVEAPGILRAGALPASSPAHVVGPVTHGLATAGSPGAITISYSVPASPAVPTTATANCSPENDPCVAEPPAGEETAFKVVAFGGNEGAQLFAILNGGLPPTCRSVGGDLSPDWVQFGFQDPKDGKTWSKRIRVTGTDPASKDAAKRELAQTQICFAAPYKFVVKRGEKLSRPDGSKNWEGLLAHCKSRIVAEAKANNPDLARPCILNRQLVAKGDGFVVRVNYFVPNGELDPQGRSLKKKKKKRG